MFSLLHPALARATALEAVQRAQAHAQPVTIRLAGAADRAELRRLAELDTAPVAARRLPSEAADGRVLVAESSGHTLAALSLGDGLLVAHPFSRTAGVASLLRLRARQLGRRTPRSAGFGSVPRIRAS